MPDIEAVLQEYHQQHRWLLSLIRDPTGAIFLQERTQEEYRCEYEARLAGMAAFLAFAGHPETRFKSVHVAGTSGKGSVVWMLSALLSACGQRTGDHVSPYYQVCNEKLRIDARMIRPSQFSALIRELQRLHAGWQVRGQALLYPQAWTALTFLWFAGQGVDWAVVETGVGGRLDPTNVLPAALAVITNVERDHANVLGPDLASIAWHKAGIIKPGVPAITAERKPQVLDILQREADEKGARLYRLDYRVGDDGVLTVNGPHRAYAGIRLRLPGGHQAENAALAIAAADILAHEHDLPLTTALIQDVLGRLWLPGRAERMPGQALVVLDGAHNPHKMHALADSIRRDYAGKVVTVLTGLVANKDADHILAAATPLAHRFIVTAPQVYGKPTFRPELLAQKLQTLAPGRPVAIAADVPAALAQALAAAGPQDLLLVTGSIYLVGEARNHWFPADELLRQLESAP